MLVHQGGKLGALHLVRSRAFEASWPLLDEESPKLSVGSGLLILRVHCQGGFDSSVWYVATAQTRLVLINSLLRDWDFD